MNAPERPAEPRLTSLSQQGVRYRGHVSSELAQTHTFENVADLLWLGVLRSRHETWRGDIVGGVDDIPIRDALRIITARVLATNPADPSLEPAAVAAAGRHLVATMVDSLPPLGDGRAPRLVLPTGGTPIRSTIAGRLWPRISARRPSPDRRAACGKVVRRSGCAGH